MLIITAFSVFYVLHNTWSVKVMIDGTIDFGPNWNFEYKVKPLSNYEIRKKISGNAYKLMEENVNFSSDVSVGDKDGSNEANDGHNVINDGYTGRTAMDYKDEQASVETNSKVTQLYKIEKFSKNRMFVDNPSKIKDDPKLTSFVVNVYNQSLGMFLTIDDEAIAHKITELKDRYASDYGTFLNDTKEHYIKTDVGARNVILHAIEYSNKLLNRLANRLKIDLNETGLRNSDKVANKFQSKINSLKISHYEDACREFDICRSGEPFSDYINSLLVLVVEEDEKELKSAVDAMIKILKVTDFSRIMDEETQKAFKRKLLNVEELNTFERRLLLTAYSVTIQHRHHPISGEPNDPTIKQLIALFRVMELFDKNINLSKNNQSWYSIKKKMVEWSAGKDRNVAVILKELVENIQKTIDNFDDNTIAELKAQLRIFILTKNSWTTIHSFVL